MAKRRSLVNSSHHFFMLVVLSVSALGLMLFTYASQQKTQTQSDASGGDGFSCARDPKLELSKNPIGGKDFVIYNLIITNRDKHNPEKISKCTPDTYRFKVKIPNGWTYIANSEDRANGVTIAEGESNHIYFRVDRPQNEKPDDYIVNFGVYNLRHEDNAKDASINLKYTVE